MQDMFQIRVMGHLDGNRAARFAGVTITNQPNGEALLVGPLVDQATLKGLLASVRELGLPLLGVMQLCGDEPPPLR